MSHDFQWKDEYSVHVEEIDNQHKQLIKMVFQLFTAISKQSTKEVLGNILDELIKYAGYHFATEEKYFREFDYEFADEHIKEHRAFGKKVGDLKERYVNNEVEISFELIDFLEDWMLKHLMTADSKYIECFKEHGLK
jgi:hemerythrin-like metal-binding protein